MGLFLISLEWTANARVCPYVSFCNGFAFKYSISWTQCPANRINWKINAYRFYFLLLACFSSKSFCPSLHSASQNGKLFSSLLVWIWLFEKRLFIPSNFPYFSVVMNSYSLGSELENKHSVSLMASYNFYLNDFFIGMQFLFTVKQYWIVYLFSSFSLTQMWQTSVWYLPLPIVFPTVTLSTKSCY